MNDSITKAIKQVYDKMPEVFHAPTFCENVRVRTFPRSPMDGTILRTLRHLRQSGKVNYKNIDKRKSKYQKAA